MSETKPAPQNQERKLQNKYKRVLKRLEKTEEELDKALYDSAKQLIKPMSQPEMDFKAKIWSSNGIWYNTYDILVYFAKKVLREKAEGKFKYRIKQPNSKRKD